MNARLLLSTLLMFWSAAATAADPAPLQPTSKWLVDYDAAQCVATREYGTAEDPLHLVIKAPPLGGVVQVALMVKSKNSAAFQDKATFAVDDGKPLQVSMLAYKEGKRLRIYLMNIPHEAFEAARNAEQLTVRHEGFRRTLSVTQMAALLRTMDDCVADLRKTFNIIDEQGVQSTLRERAQTDLSAFFNAADYPAASARAEQMGAVQIAMLIDENGTVADCSLVASSGVALLDAQTCAVAKARVRFKPAVGADGKPAKDAWCQRIVWRLEP